MLGVLLSKYPLHYGIRPIPKILFGRAIGFRALSAILPLPEVDIFKILSSWNSTNQTS